MVVCRWELTGASALCTLSRYCPWFVLRLRCEEAFVQGVLLAHCVCMSRLQNVALAVALLLFATTLLTSLHKVLNVYSQHRNQIRVTALKQALLVPTEPTLVVYLLSLADPQYRDNYLYFYYEVDSTAIQRPLDAFGAKAL